MPNKNKVVESNFHYYDHDGVQDVTFGGYQVTTTNPGVALIYYTILVCCILFFIGILFIPGSPLPLQKVIEGIKEWFSELRRKVTKDGTGSNEGGEENSTTNNDYILSSAGAAAEPSSFFYSARSSNQVCVVRAGARGKKKHTSKILPVMRTRNIRVFTVSQKDQQQQQQQDLQPSPHDEDTQKEPRNEAIIQGEKTPTHELSEKSSDYAKLEQGASTQNANILAMSLDNDRLTFDDLCFHMTNFNSFSLTNQKVGEFADINTLGDNLISNHFSSSKDKREVDISKLRNEMRVIIKWAAPWAVQSAVAFGEDIVTIVIISHFMGLRAMLCYANVWFIVDLMHIINDAWFSAVYKYVNVACAHETQEGYVSAGRLISIGMIGNAILSIPFSIIAVRFMPDIMGLLGYEESIINLSQGYALIAVISRLFLSTSDILANILDLEGYAKFNAVYDFWASLAELVCVFIFVLWLRPSLKALGVFHLVLDLISDGVFFYMTYKKGCFKSYTKGMFGFSDFSAIGTDLRAVGAATISLTGQELIDNAEGIVFTIFAAYQGPAEVATWILVCEVWEFVELVSESYAEAAAYKVSRHLARGKLELAQAVSFYSIKVGILLNVLCSIILYLFGPFFVWCLSLDDTLEQMLLEVIPYVVTCQPFVAVGLIVTELLNEALFAYKKSTVTYAIATIFIIIPLGAIATYWFKFNIEGLASAQCIGHTAVGVASIVTFMNADWNRALLKAQRNKNSV